MSTLQNVTYKHDKNVQMSEKIYSNEYYIRHLMK